MWRRDLILADLLVLSQINTSQMDTGNTIAAYIRHQSDGEQSKDTQTEYFPTNLILTSPNEEYVDWTMAVQMTTLEMTTEGSAVGT